MFGESRWECHCVVHEQPRSISPDVDAQNVQAVVADHGEQQQSVDVLQRVVSWHCRQ